jgi:hypothetical protein
MSTRGSFHPRVRLAGAVENQLRLLLAEWPTMPATVIAERIGWRYSMTTLKDRVRQIRPEELRAGHIKKRNRSHAVRARCTAWAASSCPLVINPEITPSTSAADRFWLSLKLASMRVISNSTPTMARS